MPILAPVADLTAGPLTRARTNLAIVERLVELGDNATPTGDDLELLARWSGWGPMAQAFDRAADKSWTEIGQRLAVILPPAALAQARAAVTTAYYTSNEVMTVMWRMAMSLGITDGARVLEPGCGSGRFIAASPLEVNAVGIEQDAVTARIAQLLLPAATIINEPMQDVVLLNESFDLAIGNVPFSEVTPYDKAAPEHGMSLHNYFLWRALRALRPGGYLLAVTSRYTLDSAKAVQSRAKMEQLGEFVGAIRLPRGAFRDAGTDVIADVVALRRRPVELDPPTVETMDLDGWLGTESMPAVDGLYGAMPTCNRYFLRNPHQVVGKLGVGRGQYRDHELTVAMPDGDFSTLLAHAAVTVISAGEKLTPIVDDTPLDLPTLAAADGRKLGSYHFEGDDGTIIQIVPDRTGTPVAQPVKSGKELAALIVLRNAVLDLLDLEARHEMPDDSPMLRLHRAILNSTYDAYVNRFGPINRCSFTERGVDDETGMMQYTRRRPSMGGFRDDPDYVAVCAVENYDDDTQTASKGPIFTRRVNRPPVPVTSVATAGEAVAVSMDRHGTIRPALVAALLGISIDEVSDALDGHAYLDPAIGGWVPAAEYLSGNVRVKLAEAREAVKQDPRAYHSNVAKLTEVQPLDLLPEQIHVRLGAPWVPLEVVSSFMQHLLQVPNPEYITVTRERITATWEVTSGWGQASTWDTPRMAASQLVQAGLNNSKPQVFDYVDKKAILNKEQTLLAVEKLDTIQDEFHRWVWSDPDRTRDLCAIYNNRYNATVLRTYDGSDLTFPGMADGFDPYPHQRNMVARALAMPATACGHPVGAGKTSIMGMTAMKLRETGMANKPAAVVPNHLLEQVAREIKALYPAKRILMASSQDVTKERRKLFAAKVATGDWDLVVMTHSAFNALPVSPKLERQYLAEKIARYEQALHSFQKEGPGNAGKRTVKQVQKAIDKLKERSKKLLDTRVDDGVTFDVLGIDFLQIDECFGWDTAVLTDQGSLPIGQIVDDAMDVNIASVNTETGVIEYKPIHRWVKKAHAGDLVRINHENGSIECTRNHPIWVDGVGYKRADSVTSGDHVRFLEAATAMRGLRGNVHPGQAEAPFLRQQLCSDMAELATDHGELPDAVGSGDRRPDRATETRLSGPDAHVEPDDRPRMSGEGVIFDERADLVVEAWRPRADDGTAEAAGRQAGAPDGVLYLDPASGSSVRVAPELVRRGPGGPGIEAGDRGRRELPQDPTLEVPGPTQDGRARSTRVVSVEVLERGSDGGPRPRGSSDSRGHGFVYNLEVADNHNYFADGVLVSNCHYYKNLGFPTRSGYGPPASKRAEGLALKLWALRHGHVGNGARIGMLLSGTLISNTLAEMYVMQSYLQPERLEEMEVEHFDAWSGLFVQSETKIEVAPDGGSFRMHTRPSRFNNVPELLTTFAEVADLATREQLGLGGPTPAYDTVVVEPTDALTDYVDTLVDRADAIRQGGVDPHEDNMLKVCTDGRKAALDLELVGVYTNDTGKIASVIDRVHASWVTHRNREYLGPDGEPAATTGNLQVVFCDLGTPNPNSSQVYGKIRRGLIDRGMPVEAIRFIHDAGTDNAKAALFSECRTGKVAVLLGSTDKLGVGTNVQHRMTDVHHVDAPWRPADVEQREGRGIRPGNQNDTINVHRYVRARSFDAYMWQGLERKARFIAQVLAGDPTVRQVADIDSATTLSFAEVKALSTGNPLVMDHAEASADVARLQRVEEGHAMMQRRLEADARGALAFAESRDMAAGRYESIKARIDAERGWSFSRFSSDEDLYEREEIGRAVGHKIMESFASGGGSSVHLGWYRGIELRATTRGGMGLSTWTSNKATVYARAGSDQEALLFDVDVSAWLKEGQWWRLGRALQEGIGEQELDAMIRETRERAAKNRAEAQRLADQRGPFPQADELAAARVRLDEIVKQMDDAMKKKDDEKEQAA